MACTPVTGALRTLLWSSAAVRLRININEEGYDVDLPASCRDIASTQAAGPSQGPTCARKSSTQPARPGKPFTLGRLFRCRQVSRVREDTACQCDQPAININAL